MFTPPNIIDENGNDCTQSGWVVGGGTPYSYDSVGNRTDNGGSYTTGNRITAFASCTYTTDLDGNVTQRSCPGETVTFTWSAEGKLTGMTVNGVALAFHYDAGGRLLRKDVAGAPQRHFVWDGASLLAELDGAGTVKQAEYSYKLGLDNPHALIVGSTQYFAHVDGLGNVIALTDTAKVVQRTYGYGPWGALSGGTDYGSFAGKDRARFKGALWLGPEIEVYHMRARWYEPKTGRFLSEDPIGLAGGINPYVFARGDPVNGFDPLGLDPCRPWCELDGIVSSAAAPGPVDPLTMLQSWGWWFSSAHFGLGGGGGGWIGGGGGGAAPTIADIGTKAEERCTAAVLFTTASVAADITLYSTVRAGVLLGRTTGVLERYAMLRSADGARTVARGVGLRSGELAREAALEYRGAALAAVQGAGASGAAAIASGSGFTFWDALPVIGSIRAGISAYNACFRPGEL